MMTEAEKRLRKNYIEKYDKGENISLYTNSMQCTKDIKEVLNILEEARNRAIEMLDSGLCIGRDDLDEVLSILEGRW